MRDSLVLVWVEREPERVHRLQALGFEDAAQLSLEEPHALDPRGPFELFRDRRERASEPGEDIEYFRDEVRLRELHELGERRLVALPVGREIGPHALPTAGTLLRPAVTL